MFRAGPSAMVGIWEIPIPGSSESLLKFRRNTALLPEVLNGVNSFPGLEKTGVVYDKHGKPYLSDPSKGSISISHSKNRIAIIYDTKHPTGIDLEEIGQKVVRIQHKFMSEEELSHPGVKDQSIPLHIYWGVKESMYKFYGKRGLVFSQHLRVFPFTIQFPGEVNAEIRIGGKENLKSLKYELRENFMLVYILNS